MPRPRPVSDAPRPHRDSMFVSPPPTPSAPQPEFQPCIPVVTASSPSTRQHLSPPAGESSGAPQSLLARYIAVLQRLSCGSGGSEVQAARLLLPGLWWTARADARLHDTCTHDTEDDDERFMTQLAALCMNSSGRNILARIGRNSSSVSSNSSSSLRNGDTHEMILEARAWAWAWPCWARYPKTRLWT